MKNVFLFIVLCLACLACTDVEKQAAERLNMAQQAFAAGDYNEAKLQIDSIKILYPKAYNARKAGIGLMQEVELKEQQKSLAYLDSLLSTKQAEFNAMKGKFVLEKDQEYEAIGRYLHPSQVIEKNLNRSFLRFQVDERGAMSMTSIYCGSRNIHHTAVKVSTNDSFAQTPPSADSYETSNLGVQIEKADYKLGQDDNVIGFICLNKERNIKVEFVGERSYSTQMTQADRQAADLVYRLSQTLSAITQLNKEIDEAKQKIAFIEKRMEERAHHTN
jgi:hypothetical protein